jgi:hypothetical protein
MDGFFYPEIKDLLDAPLETYIDVGANEGLMINQVREVYPQVKIYQCGCL